MAEFDFIRWVRNRSPASPRVPLGIGDDCASILWTEGKPVLFKTDMLLEGSCFTLDAGAYRIGRKAMSVNLSDIAAMAGQPIAAVTSLGLPRKHGQSLAEDLYRGLQERAGEFGVHIVGGDTNSWNGPLVISLALIGEPTDPGPITRAGAQPGDWLMVTGFLGGSILGHHLDFTPRIREAQKLHQLVRLKAMLDISDGLAADLHHICEESHCGAVLHAESIPLSPAAHQMQDSKSPLEHALGDGEDFELLFAVSPQDGKQLLKTQPLRDWNVNLSHLGEFLPEPGVFLHENHHRKPLPPLGYVHQLSSSEKVEEY